MRVTVTGIRGSAPSLVEFTSDVGNADAIWRGHSPPELQDYDVELNIPGQLRWGAEAEIDAAAAAGISRVGAETRVVGRVVECDDIGVLSLELAGSLVMVELADGPPSDVAGANVSLRIRRLELYPSSI